MFHVNTLIKPEIFTILYAKEVSVNIFKVCIKESLTLGKLKLSTYILSTYCPKVVKIIALCAMCKEIYLKLIFNIPLLLVSRLLVNFNQLQKK